MGGGRVVGWGGRWISHPYRSFGIAVATTIYLPCRGDVHGAMVAVPGLFCCSIDALDAILLTMTLQGWQNALQKNRPVHTGQ